MGAASAKGLFRATGKKRKAAPGDILRLDGTTAPMADKPREANDFYPTPLEPIRAFIKAEAPVLRHYPLIWGPAAGTGVIGRELRAAGLHTVESDLIDRGAGIPIADFFAVQEAPARAIVENPPFQEVGWGNGKARWIYHALDTLGVEYMALLLNWGWPGAGGLKHLWRKHPPARVYLMRWKIDFTGEGAPPMLHAWFVWNRGFQGDPVLKMLDRADDHRQDSML